MLSLLTALTTVAAIGAGRPDVRPIAASLSENQKAARNQIAELSKDCDMFYTDCGRYPTASEGLSALEREPVNNCEGKWGPDPYTDESLIDPWGYPLIYKSNDSRNYTIISYGADGREGGTGEDADIVSR